MIFKASGHCRRRFPSGVFGQRLMRATKVIVCEKHSAIEARWFAHFLRDAATFKEMEQQAHQFASSFLLPARTFGSEWIKPELDSFKNIKLKWKSSGSSPLSLWMIPCAQTTGSGRRRSCLLERFGIS
jgi:hypothetical protein